MDYMIQMHTGSFGHANISIKEAQKAITRVVERVNVKGLIWGWAAAQELNEQIIKTAEKYNLETYIWLPVFAEVMNPEESDPFITESGSNEGKIVLNQDESFEFVCPSSEKNIENAKKMFDCIRQDLPVTGVFLDRIRYPSAANSFSAYKGCSCEICNKKKGRLKSSDMDQINYFKRNTITAAAKELCDYFHGKGLKVGIDTFAPLIADSVGQDLQALCELTDFIKPMMYEKTTAPAGLPFEVEALERYARQQGAGESIPTCSMKSQLQQLQAFIKKISPGIEINKVPGICETNPEYVQTAINTAKEAGCETVTLSWNISMIAEEILNVL